MASDMVRAVRRTTTAALYSAAYLSSSLLPSSSSAVAAGVSSSAGPLGLCLVARASSSSPQRTQQPPLSHRRSLATPAFLGGLGLPHRSINFGASPSSATASSSAAFIFGGGTSRGRYVPSSSTKPSLTCAWSSRRSMSSSPSDTDAAAATVDVASNLATVLRRIDDAVAARRDDAGDGGESSSSSVRLVAVSKTKPVEMLREAYEAGQRRFGENYAQELMAKASEMPSDVEWHFIGPLQSNKAAPLVKALSGPKQLKCIETVSTLKLANKLNKAVEGLAVAAGEKEGSDTDTPPPREQRLGIYLQVNTSGEETKSGVSPGSDLFDLAATIESSCPYLSIDGLMTIGAPGDESCFETLVECRADVAESLRRDVRELELSMGMSGDFEVAIAKGATSVRVGSTIFGQRDYSNLNKK